MIEAAYVLEVLIAPRGSAESPEDQGSELELAIELANAYIITSVVGEAAAAARAVWAIVNKAPTDCPPKPEGITSAQQANIDRFADKLPANAQSSITVRQLPNGGVAAQGTSPGRVPGSSAVYEKQIDASGQTSSYTKTTYDPAGNIVSVKDKINGGIIP